MVMGNVGEGTEVKKEGRAEQWAGWKMERGKGEEEEGGGLWEGAQRAVQGEGSQAAWAACLGSAPVLTSPEFSPSSSLWTSQGR